MTSDATKIQTFLKLIQETSIAAEHQQPLITIANQLTDDDEKNVALIENWLQNANLWSFYQQRLKSFNPLLAAATGEKGGFRSQAKSSENSQCLKDVIIEQATKKNTNLPEDPSTSSEGKL